MDNITDSTGKMDVTIALGIQNEDGIISLAATFLLYKIGKNSRDLLLHYCLFLYSGVGSLAACRFKLISCTQFKVY